MGFEKLRVLDSEVTIALGGINKKTNKPNPTKIEGYYLGSKTVADAKKKSGVSYIHILETAQGVVGVWGKTALDNQLKNVTPGTMTRITQNSKRKTPNGDMYLFEVEIDRTNTCDVGSLAQAGGYDEAASEEGNGGYEDAEEAGLEEYETPADEITPQRTTARATATAPDAARQAKVQAMLAGKGARKTA